MKRRERMKPATQVSRKFLADNMQIFSPCPFCGEKKLTLEIGLSRDSKAHRLGTSQFSIDCRMCGCQYNMSSPFICDTPSLYDKIMNKDEWVKMAADMWNKRDGKEYNATGEEYEAA